MKGPLITPSEKAIRKAENKRKAAQKREKEKRRREEMARRAAEAEQKRAAKPPKTPKPKNWYTNEILNERVNSDGVMVYIILVIAGLAFFLIGLSIFHMIRDALCIPGLTFSENLYNHPLGFSFGIALLVMAYAGVSVDNTFNLIGHYWPKCGDTKYTRKEVDDQANSPDTVYLNGVSVFLAPEILIGMDKGVTAIKYEEVATLGFKKMYHTKRDGMKKGTFTKYIDYYSYRIVATLRNGRRLVISESGQMNESVLNTIADRCREFAPDVRIVEMKRSLLA